MAGDWIKMRNNLWDDPRVARLCDITGSSEATIIGGLYWLWAAADEHTEDGKMHGLTLGSIDRKTGIKGFGDALVEIGWLTVEEDGVTLVKFSEHNGSSAKRRCADAQRKASSRTVSASDADILRTECGQKADTCGHFAELEKNREEKEKKNKSVKAQAPTRPTQEEVEEYTVSLGLPKTDGTACFNKWTGSGWKNGGNPIKDWKATIRSWQLHGYLPSQKGGSGTATTAATANIRMV